MKYFIHLPMKMEPIVSSETSAIRTQTPGNYPKSNNLRTIHSKFSKGYIYIYIYTHTHTHTHRERERGGGALLQTATKVVMCHLFTFICYRWTHRGRTMAVVIRNFKQKMHTIVIRFTIIFL